VPGAADRPFGGRYRRLDLAIVAGVLLVIVVLVAVGSGAKPARADHAIALTSAGDPIPIPAGFLGVSIEYSSVEQYAGSDPRALNPLLIRLLRNLSPGQAPVLRIGGESADRSWWPVAGVAQPAGVNFTIDSRWLNVMRQLAGSLGARLILGLNLEAGVPQLASAEADALVRGIGSSYIRTLELGNEPDLYGRFAWYRTPDGTKVTGRSHSYDFNSFTHDFATAAAGLPSSFQLAGPSFGTFGWTKYLSRFIAAQPRLRLVTLHRYPLQHCFIHPRSPRYPTIANLLSRHASTGLADRFAPYVATARAHGLPLRIDELNSVACGAVPSVSQSFAAALWALDALFEFVRVGAAGVNIHTFPRAGYDLFHFTHAGSEWGGSVAPEYYGLLMFARATPPGAKLLRVASAQRPDIKIWVTRAPDGVTRAVLINKSQVHNQILTVRLPGASKPAALMRLRAPNIQATTGAGLNAAGQVSDVDGRYTLRLPAGSAAMLTIAAS
jgi:hypothetical protein